MFSHRKIPSFSLTSALSSALAPTASATPSSTSSLSPDSTVPSSRGRSLSPFRRSKSRERAARGESHERAEGLPRIGKGEESEVEDDASRPVVCPSNAFDSSESDSDEEEEDLGGDEQEEEVTERNTEANASKMTPLDFLSSEPVLMTFAGEGPNLIPPPLSILDRVTPKRRNTKTEKTPALSFSTGRPIFEKNRCTITLVHGDPAKFEKEGKRVRKYVVASDLSEESLYAIQWAVGTVLRDGDQCYIVSVLETDTKLDANEGTILSAAEKKAKNQNQKDRQLNAAILARQTTALLERTRLNVTVYCQSLHAKNARHMLVDIIDFFEPTMVIIGTRGLTKIKGMLLGSVSNYLIQKSSAPVMVTRRPLRVTRTVHKKLSSLSRESRVALKDAVIEKDSHGGEVDADPNEPSDITEKVAAMEISKN